ncbi:MAG: hypothetical protein C4290_10985, partial [Chloroflexota bacterium]
YHTADEFRAALGQLGFDVSAAAAFPVIPRERGTASRVAAGLLSWARRMLEAMGLIPKTLRGRARLKRLVCGKLLETPAEIPEG